MKRTNAQSKRLYALLRKLNIDNDTKVDMVYSISCGRTTHSSELSYTECKLLIDKLQELYKTTEAYRKERTLNNTRWRLIYALRDKGMATPDGKPDYDRIHKYCLHYWHRDINAMTLDELNRYIGTVRKWPKLKNRCHESGTNV